MRILSRDDVRTALPMAAAIEGTRRAFRALAEGLVVAPARPHLAEANGRGVTLVMPARIEGDHAALAVKVVSVFDGNPERGLARSLAAVLVLDPATGRPLALLEGSALTALRTAAASAVATDLLARPDASRMAVLGAGVQARSHIEAICAVRAIDSIAVYAPTLDHVEQLIADVQGKLAGGVTIRGVRSAADAVREADVVCATTNSSTPVFRDSDVADGAHVNAVGAYTPEAREVPPETVARAWIVVDDRDAAWSEAGDLIRARAEGFIEEADVRADLGQLVTGACRRPEDSERVTLFKSVGVAVQDAVCASDALAEARRLGLGVVVDW